MKGLFRVLAGIVAACALAPGAMASGPSVANGGGRGTEDGTTPFSQFGFGITRSDSGAVHGSFNCLMAGASRFPGFTLMAVRGQVTHANISGSAASFDGTGMLQTGNQGKFPATFHVEVTAGGPGAGTLHLTLLTPFVFDLPVEHVLNGRINVH
jgi:hypothetical protein